MKILELENHIRETIAIVYPQFTDSWKDATSASVVNDVMTVNAVTDLKAGDEILLRDLVYNNPVSSIVISEDLNHALITTTEVHEFTLGFKPTITLSGSNEAEWNDTFEIVSIPDRFTIQISIVESIDNPPTGSTVVEEPDLPRYNSTQTVVSVVAGVSFDVDVINSPDTTLTGVPQYILINDVCVSSVLTMDELLRAYTKQKTDKLFLFVVPAEIDTSLIKMY